MILMATSVARSAWSTALFILFYFFTSKNVLEKTSVKLHKVILRACKSRNSSDFNNICLLMSTFPANVGPVIVFTASSKITAFGPSTPCEIPALDRSNVTRKFLKSVGNTNLWPVSFWWSDVWAYRKNFASGVKYAGGIFAGTCMFCGGSGGGCELFEVEALEVEASEVEGLGGSIGDLGSGEYFCGGARFECSGAWPWSWARFEWARASFDGIFLTAFGTTVWAGLKFLRF